MNKQTEKSTTLLLKLDATDLYGRLKTRLLESLTILAIKRKRDHFEALFQNKYSRLSIPELSYLDEDCLVSIHNFYQMVEELEWYLNHTEDQPQMIEDTAVRALKKIDGSFDTLCLYIDAALGIRREQEILQEAPQFGEDPDSLESIENFDE